MTLSKADVALLKTTADAFAASYTSGADAAKDNAALSAAETGMQTLLANIWSETHVVSKDALTKLQQSVDSFVSSYSSGKNVAQDTSAWASLQAGLNDFWTSVDSSGGGATNPMPMPMPMPMSMPVVAMPMTTTATSVSVAGTGAVTSGAVSTAASGAVTTASATTSPDFMLAPMTISKADVTKLQQAVDAFAAAYTSGSDPAADKTALSNLESSLSSLSQDWQLPTPMPTPPPTPVPATLPPSPAAPPASTVSTVPASTAAPSTSTVSTAPANTAAPSTSTVSTTPASTATTSPPPSGPIQPNLPPGAFVSMPISSLTRWIPGIGRPLGAPVVVAR